MSIFFSDNHGQTIVITDGTFSFELSEFEEAITPYGTIETKPSPLSNFIIDDFTDGNHFRTGPDDYGALQLETEDRLLTIVLDESGSMTWNDHNRDRYTYFKRILNKLQNTYPGNIRTNLIGFGGLPTRTYIFIAKSDSDFLKNPDQNFDLFLQQTFQDSVFDFAGIRVVRRTDRFPVHPADGVVISQGIFDAIKDENLTEGQIYYYGIWTFNKNMHFGNGQFIKGFPSDRNLPLGVNIAQGIARKLPGVKRDDFTKLIYNFIEGSGYLVFDSSGNGNHGAIGTEVIEDNFWSGDASHSSYVGDLIKRPVGVRFDGIFDIIETPVENFQDVNPSPSNDLTINLWMFRYINTKQQWVIGTSSNTASNNVGWSIGITETGQIGAQGGDVSSGYVTISNSSVPEKLWTMVTVVFHVVSGNLQVKACYINGVLDYIDALSIPFINNNDTIYIGAKLEDSSVTWNGTDYFGSLNLISIHNTERDAEYIEELYEKESIVFSQSAIQFYQDPPDNKQREVLLTWSIADDFNFAGGNVQIVRKYNKVPSHIEDGDLIATISADSGQFFYIDSFDFTNNTNYYYKIFTVNSLGLVCDRREARTISVHIPRSINEDADPPLSSVENEIIIEGNHKIYLQWNNPTDDRVRGTRVYFSNKEFPVVNINPQGNANISNGTLLTDTDKESFVHRIFTKETSGAQTPLTNGLQHYYTIITYDKYNRVSSPKNIIGMPSSELDEIFPSDEIKDLYLEVVNPKTLSLQWIIPTIKSERLDLYFGESSLIYINIKDIYGGALFDLKNIKLQVCTFFIPRKLQTTEREIQDDNDGSGSNNPFIGNDFGSVFCQTPETESETVLSYATVEDGLIKGMLTHTNNRQILSRRKQYIMDVRAQYLVKKSENENTFEFNTSSVRVTFTHPFRISIVNKLNKKIRIGPAQDGRMRGMDSPCECPTSSSSDSTITEYNGGYANSTQPYVARVEIQYKGRSLPDGTPVKIQLFKHGISNTNPNPLSEKSTRTFIREGIYSTHSITIDEITSDGPTGRLVTKSIVDVEMPHPALSDFVDLYVSMDYLGFFIDAVHSVKFIETLFLTLDVTPPFSDGIDIREQFATAWVVDPNNPELKLPVPDGTMVKWELIKLHHGKQRPFYSTMQLPQSISGVYSFTNGGVARNVFFGPVGNIESHHETRTCEDVTDPCCIGEQYAIKASIFLGTEAATDTYKFHYLCQEEQQFANRRFLMNADTNQPLAGGPSQAPHWITWADGIHMLKFQIAKNPAISNILGAECFRQCVQNQVGGQLFQFPEQHIVQIKAAGEILWNVVFDEDPYTNEKTIVSYDSISPSIAENLGIPFIANIPITGETTDFYVRYNTFVQNDPSQEECRSGSFGFGDSSISPCEWRGICEGSSGCVPTGGIKWNGVSTVEGRSTLISQNKEVTLFGGGNYIDGIPPIYMGFREPLNVRIVDARVNGQRIEEIVVDGVSFITFTVEVTFAGKPVPDGTPVELNISGSDQSVVIISSCINTPAGCFPGSSGIIYTQQINDHIINPQNSSNNIPKRSLAFFSINPLPNISFSAKINVTCRYDKLGEVNRVITKCIEVNNIVNIQAPTQTPILGSNIESSATSNDLIVYDTINDNYHVTKGNRYKRMGHFAAGVSTGTSDYMFIFGGLTGNGDSSTQNLTPRVEKFDLQTQEWSSSTDMLASRAYGQVVSDETHVYIIGGIELDVLQNQYVVSRKIETFNVRTEMWNTTLSPMPENFGVAFGNANLVDGYIYVTCGVTSIENSSQPGDMNKKILRYSIEDDAWEIINPSNINLYNRIAPFSFYRSLPEPTTLPKQIYVNGGSIAKPLSQIEAERNNEINTQINHLYSFLISSQYYNNLPLFQQEDFREEREREIRESVSIPAFIYPLSGFKFTPGEEFVNENNELEIDIISLDQEWSIFPAPRDNGQAIYIERQDAVYFIGGGNQNKSTTLNRNEIIHLADNNQYTRLTPLNRGRSMFGAVEFNDEIYLTGGLTSGHAPGYVEIDVSPKSQLVEARGIETGGLFVTLKNDSGEVIDHDIRVDIRGRLRIPAIDSILSQFIARRAADRALGGTGAGDAPDISDEFDIGKLISAQNKITDPNSDLFQFNASRKLNEDILLFPILYTTNETVIRGGIGGTTLLPRSEDPLNDFQKLAEFIRTVLQNSPDDEDERFTGDLTQDELAALGETLSFVQLPPTIINPESVRDLYSIETKVTVLDPVYFGQTISQFDLDIQEQIESNIIEILNPTPPSQDQGVEFGDFFGGTPNTQSSCFVIQHSATPDVPGQSSGIVENSTNAPRGVGGFAGSGQCLFCQTIIPTNVDIRTQLPNVSAVFYNSIQWVPQIKRRLVSSESTLSEAIDVLDTIDYEIPFGASQVYDALVDASFTTSGEELNFIKKSIYVASDNSENLSLNTRNQAIQEINSIDGNRNVPVTYAVFSTSYPVSLSAQMERSKVGDVEKITTATGGQSTTLINSGFLNQIINLAIGPAVGGMGYGIYTRKFNFEELTTFTGLELDFDLPPNTNGFVRFRKSEDGFNFSDYSERFQGNGEINIGQFLAKSIEIEVVLTTGFTITDTSDDVASGIPKLLKITWEKSEEKEDFMFLHKEEVNTNAQQIALAFEGTTGNSIVEIGVASSDSCDWRDFQNSARPAIREFGKTFLLNRSPINEEFLSVVPDEHLITKDGLLYSSIYGPWDPTSQVKIMYNDTEILSGYTLYPRDGQVYFDTKQPLEKTYKIIIINDSCLKIGLRFRNLSHTQPITMEGIGYIYNTNDQKPVELSQVAPRAINVQISPISPTSQDTIFALYKYLDLNNDKEKGTSISWFKNGIQLLEIQNQISWSNANLLPQHKLEPNDRIYFQVIPSDGKDFGTAALSPTVVIQAQVPIAENIKIVPYRNGSVNNKFDTSSVFELQYSFNTEDTGIAGLENGTIIRWLVNGNIFKELTFSQIEEQDPYSNPKLLTPGEIINGVIAHSIGNQIQVEVIPRTSVVQGTLTSTSLIIVENSVPFARNVTVTPLTPTRQSTLTVSWDVDDLDISSFNTQTDQSEISWFQSPNGVSFSEVLQLKGSKTVSSSFLIFGNHWKARITPFDGLDTGPVIESNTVILS